MNYFTRQEPSVAKVNAPAPKPKTQAAMDFFDEHEQTCQDLAFYKDEATRLNHGIKLANEHIKMLKDELNFVRDERDRLLLFQGSILNGIDIICSIATEQRAKALSVRIEKPEPAADHPNAQSAMAAIEAAIAAGEEPQG